VLFDEEMYTVQYWFQVTVNGFVQMYKKNKEIEHEAEIEHKERARRKTDRQNQRKVIRNGRNEKTE
jgi:hypothetical protein